MANRTARFCPATPVAGFLALLLAISAPLPVKGEVEVFSHKGSMSRNTPEFEVRAPWVLEWRVTTGGAYESAVDVSLFEAGTGAHEGRVLMTKYPGNGVKLFQQSGKYYFRVDSAFANWSLRVIELTEEEAALYTPKDRSLLNR